MKVALLTIWHEENFGAELQNYATVRALHELGHDVEVIDFRLADKRKVTIHSLVRTFIRYISPNGRNFREFWKIHIPSGKRYKSLKALKANPPKADMYLVGSDQVWNPDITGTLYPTYFLDFGSASVKKASYASSIGKNYWDFDSETTEQVRICLRLFSHLSCREETGCRILKDVFGLEADCVLDPTLLHTNYDELTGFIEQTDTLAYYPLYEDSETEEYSRGLAAKLGLTWKSANYKDYTVRGIVWNRTSLTEWIKTIASARFVITRSFHGLAMSLLYHRQFVIVCDSERSSRITDLLGKLGLQDRCFASIEDVESKQPWLSTIDYDKVDERLQTLRALSWNYLSKITSGS